MGDEQKELNEMIVGAIETAHADAMSDNEQIALVGRARKAMIESTLRWIYAEEERGTDLSNIVCGLAYYSGGVVAKMATAYRDSVKDERDAPDDKKLTSIFSDALKEESAICRRLIAEENAKKFLASLTE